MNKRQKKKLWKKIYDQEINKFKHGIICYGEGISLGYGWIYNRRGNPMKLI